MARYNIPNALYESDSKHSGPTPNENDILRDLADIAAVEKALTDLLRSKTGRFTRRARFAGNIQPEIATILGNLSMIKTEIQQELAEINNQEKHG